MKKAIIKRVAKGKHKGEFIFILKAANGETVGHSHPESYTEKHSASDTLKSCFPDFEIVDKSDEADDSGYKLVDDTD
jgi:uncharacterized protein YegP (UPF0339 family)